MLLYAALLLTTINTVMLRTQSSLSIFILPFFEVALGEVLRV